MNVYDDLKKLDTNDLIELQINITQILQKREINEDTVKNAYIYLSKIKPGSVRYTDLTLYLEKYGLKRESISRKLIDMWSKNPRIAHGGSPIGEHESDENPIYPYLNGVKYIYICYLTL